MKNKVKEILKSRGLGNLVKKSVLYKTIQHSVGNWRYPLFAVNWRIAHFLTRRRQVKVNGVKFSLPCKNWITHFRWFLIHKKEPEVRHYVDRYLEDGDTFFDVGANIGIVTLYANKKHGNLKTYSFEPEYSNLALLKENIVANRLTENVNVFSVGISDFVGISQLHLQDLEEGAAAHTESKKNIEQTDEGYRVVWSEGIATVTIDYMCEQLGIIPNGIKIDTDGNELKILTGAKETLKNPMLRSIVLEIPEQEEKRHLCEKVLISSGLSRVWSEPGSNNEIWSK